MKVLVVGGGGREHAIIMKLKQSAKVTKLYCAPGNAGTAGASETVALKADDIEGLVAFCVAEGMDYVVVGPEVPLNLGLVDALEAAGIQAFGPTRQAARLEGSKVFSKGFMRRHGIPTGAYRSFSCDDAGAADKAKAFARELPSPWVVKADGLAAGKGALICQTIAEADEAIDMILVDKVFGSAGDSLVIEEYLDGEELSLMAFTDGKTVVPMIAAQDHKRIFDNDRGPNTGGMGAYAPAPVCSPELASRIYTEILKPAVAGMAAEGREIKGVLYAGLMLTAKGPMVLEYNTRFGDPETEVVLPLLESDLLDIMLACSAGGLERMPIQWKHDSCVTVVMASAGYPGEARNGDIIRGLSMIPDDVTVYHCGTKRDDSGNIITAGGRILSVTACGATLPEALNRAYDGVRLISFDGAQYRSDIAARALTHRL